MKRSATLLVLPLAIVIFSMLQLYVATAAGALPAMMASAAVIDRTYKLDKALALKYFDQPSSIQMLDSIQIPLRTGKFSLNVPQALKSVSFADENLLEQAVSGGTLPPGTGAVIYDAESWPHTPDVQKQSVANLALYYRRAANAAHSHNPRLLLIATPAVDLVKVLAPDSPDRYAKFIALGIPAAAARYADVYESQGQGVVDDTARYKSFTQQAAQQASGANPTVKNLGGLSTGPNGKEQTAQVLVDAAHATAGSVAGWWINDPSGGPECPGCKDPHPETVVDFLLGL